MTNSTYTTPKNPHTIKAILDHMGFSKSPQDLFSTYYKYADSDFSNLDGPYLIPPISHQVWLTNPHNPKEIKDEDLTNLKQKIHRLNWHIDTTWEHFLWTNCKSCIPISTQALESLNVTVNDIANFNGQLKTIATVNDLIQKKLIGLAADLLRYDVVSKFGGFYSDLNYEIYKSPEHLMKSLNFFGDSETSNIEGQLKRQMRN